MVFASAGMFSSCKYPTEYQTVNAGKFSISVPPWTKKQEDLAPNASFQYANRFRNFYAIGMVLDKDTVKAGFDGLLGNNVNMLKHSLGKPVVTDSVEVNIGGLKGTRVEIYGKMNDDQVYFSELLLEGKSRYYHLSVWTRGQDRKLKFKDDIDKILNSFKENP